MQRRCLVSWAQNCLLGYGPGGDGMFLVRFYSLAFERPSQVFLLSGGRASGFIPEDKITRHQWNHVGEFPVHLLGVLEMSFSETLVIGFARFWSSLIGNPQSDCNRSTSFLTSPICRWGLRLPTTFITSLLPWVASTRSSGGARRSDYIFRGEHVCHGNHNPLDRGQARPDGLVGLLFLVLFLTISWAQQLLVW